jgi:exodeoxyribonuclease V gamma subunit
MPTDSPENPITPGFIVLHGNRSEDLAQTLITWLGGHPLAPLEEEVILVQSSGMAEWFKMALAQQSGVCSAARVELPGRFVWRAYRQVLGAQAVPRESPLDKLPMTWRLMQVLPGLLAQPEFAPMARYLQAQAPSASPMAPSLADDTRLLQLASQLADLFDQYQNYRTDWLQAWAAGRDELSNPAGQAQPLAEDQRWQPALWRAVVGTLTPAQRSATRPDLHRQVLDKLQGGEDFAGRVPRRLVVFGMSHIPGAMLEMLAALAPHSQVILAVPNPCRFYWGDIMEGRELFKIARRRHPNRQALSAPPALEDMHMHAHPLLAAWGRQGRDFVRQLDAFDDAVATAQAFPLLKIDLFDEATETADTPMLTRVQQRIRDLEPLGVRHDDAPLATDDRSVVFHVAHSPVRELEVLHDQLLAMLAGTRQTGQKGQKTPLNPRDIVVMVPDVQSMAPAIRAVFGQYPRHDKRFIPFDIADLSAKSSSPVIQSVEWLLGLPVHRCGLSELVDLLEVPAVAQRFGIDAEKRPQLTQWMAGAGIRWGLHAEQRAQLDLAACGDQNSAWFGLQRMLLGYAAGDMHDVPHAQGWQGTEPYAEVGGLDAELAGGLAHLLQTLSEWWLHTQRVATPEAWREHAQWLLAALFKAADEVDTQALTALQDGLSHWLRACEQAGFAQEVGLAALRQGWMDALQVPSLEQRFRAGGVTFCTLMPMRAIPFEVVCLLGMNDGDYPRRTQRSDFDLMGQRGMFRPGDRSRQHDDRQLMLEALLSARRALYVSWTGHSVRDNSEQPPSVLVSQLRDYIASAWGDEAVKVRTTSHPLQPFNRRYFEAGSPLLTYAREWRSVHDAQSAAGQPSDTVLPEGAPDTRAPLDQERLVRFLRNPVKAFFKERFGVSFWSPEDEPGDTEAFGFDGLENYQLIQSQIQHWPAPTACAALDEGINRQLDALQRAGGLPMQGLGQLKKSELQGTLTAMAQAWTGVGQAFPEVSERIAVSHNYTDSGTGTAPHPTVVLRDWLDGICQNDAGERAWVMLEASKLTAKSGKTHVARPDKLLHAWLQSMLAAAAGQVLQGRVVGQDGELHILPMPPDLAFESLNILCQVWLQGQQAPLPLPLKTALVLASGAPSEEDGKTETKAEVTYEGGGDTMSEQLAEVREMCLARVFPNFEALCAAKAPNGMDVVALARLVYGPLLAWSAQCVTAMPYE